jgi:hypothetical protein
MSTSTYMNQTRDINGYNTFGIPFAVDNQFTILSSGVAQNFTVPSNFENWDLVFSFEPGAKVWVANNTTAAIPTGAFAATASQLNPAVRQVKAGDVISFITDNVTAEVGVSLYALQHG